MEQRNKIIHRYSQAETNEQRCMLCIKALMGAMPYLLLYFFIPGLCLAIGYVLSGQEMSSQEFFTYGGNFYTALGMVISLWFLRRRAKKCELTLVTGFPTEWSKAMVEKSVLFFLFGLCASLFLSCFLTLLAKLPFLTNVMTAYETASQTPYVSYDLLYGVVVTVLLAPLLEEVIFRGYVLDTLLQIFDERAAIVICTVVFALCHVNGVWVISAAGIGYILVYVALREDGVFYPILCHMGANLPSAILFFLYTLFPTAQMVMDHALFLLSLLVLSGSVCGVLFNHYRNQSKDSYQSIWRYSS